MDSSLIWKLLFAGVFVMMLFRMYPATKQWMENGPKGDKSDWLAAALPLVGVIALVLLLIISVRG